MLRRNFFSTKKWMTNTFEISLGRQEGKFNQILFSCSYPFGCMSQSFLNDYKNEKLNRKCDEYGKRASIKILRMRIRDWYSFRDPINCTILVSSWKSLHFHKTIKKSLCIFTSITFLHRKCCVSEWAWKWWDFFWWC